MHNIVFFKILTVLICVEMIWLQICMKPKKYLQKGWSSWFAVVLRQERFLRKPCLPFGLTCRAQTCLTAALPLGTADPWLGQTCRAAGSCTPEAHMAVDTVGCCSGTLDSGNMPGQMAGIEDLVGSCTAGLWLDIGNWVDTMAEAGTSKGCYSR